MLIENLETLERYGSKIFEEKKQKYDIGSKLRLIDLTGENADLSLSHALHKLDYNDICRRHKLENGLKPEDLEPEVYFDYAKSGGLLHEDTFWSKLAQFSCYRADESKRVIWECSLKTISILVFR